MQLGLGSQSTGLPILRSHGTRVDTRSKHALVCVYVFFFVLSFRQAHGINQKEYQLRVVITLFWVSFPTKEVQSINICVNVGVAE
jgi:hypothetical protein